jgi:hypothetical protein
MRQQYRIAENSRNGISVAEGLRLGSYRVQSVCSGHEVAYTAFRIKPAIPRIHPSPTKLNLIDKTAIYDAKPLLGDDRALETHSDYSRIVVRWNTNNVFSKDLPRSHASYGSLRV